MSKTRKNRNSNNTTKNKGFLKRVISIRGMDF